MSKPRVTLVTGRELPELSEDDQVLPPLLEERGIDVQIAIWDDPDVNWDEAGLCIIRTVPDYAPRRKEFFEWAHTVPKLLNNPTILEWNSDKHYLHELAGRGLPTIETTWLEVHQDLSKHQVHTRFPAGGDFVVKPAVSSGQHSTGRYTAREAYSRMAAIQHAMEILDNGHAAMVQRYLVSMEERGEISLIFFNGLLSHAVEKDTILDSPNGARPTVHRNRAHPHAITSGERTRGEDVRAALHESIKQLLGRDEQLIYCRIDMVAGDDELEILEVSLFDCNLYLTSDHKAAEAFADAIAMRAFW
ncbi:ATP-grasp domain-containing protein [Bowdeniella massiliensis]|uniref:ATP-grasp domain-containing protein n=1 Tax=Bowdeniella massiliensis TaxID=2932264 RepID=UPI002028DEBE